LNTTSRNPTVDQWLSLCAPTPTPPPSASERLIRALEAHASSEAQDTSDCESLVQGVEDPSAKLLIDLVIEEQHRHRTLLDSMIRRLQEQVECLPSPAAPPVGLAETAPNAGLAVALRTLIRNAHEGSRHLRHIARQEPHVYDGLYAILLEGIARDAEKQAALMRFLLLRAEGRRT
jgi:hypothetical protein